MLSTGLSKYKIKSSDCESPIKRKKILVRKTVGYFGEWSHVTNGSITHEEQNLNKA